MEKKQEQYTEQIIRERDPLDALREWYHLVPEELRRVEYEYFKYFRTKKMLRKHTIQKMEAHGRFTKIPEYTKENEEEDWNNFRESFLLQKEKKQKLLDTISLCKADLPIILEKIKKELPDIVGSRKFSNPQAFILGGSTVIGPRDVDKDQTSDIDIYVIMKDESFARGSQLQGFQILDMVQSRTGIKYQLFFESESLRYLPSFIPIHIFAQPHIILSTIYSTDETTAMTREVIEKTVKNLPQIQEKLSTLQSEQEEKKKLTIFE